LQQLQDNNIRKFPSEKKKGLTGAIIIYSALLLILIFVGFKIPPPPEFEEGILVNFGTGETGFGMLEPATFIATPTSLPAAATRPVRSPEEPLLTQDSEEAPEVRRVDPNAESRRLEQAEAERIRRETLEAERRRIEEEQRQTDIRNRTRDALAGSGNTNSDSNSEGIAGGTGNQGSPTGSPDSNVRGPGGNEGSGVSYSLGDRGHLSLPLPRYDCQVAGRVVVAISVDREGRVTQARSGVQGSNEINDCLVNAARDAAMQARFEPRPNAPAIQTGTITYNFILR
jgi:TonB family protein